MDPHRRYAEDPEPSWRTGQPAPETTGSHAAPAAGGTAWDPAPGGGSWDSASQERPSGAFRLPDQRPGGYPSLDPVTSTGGHVTSAADSGVLRVPVRGPEYPAVRPAPPTAPAYSPATEATPAYSPATEATPAYNPATETTPAYNPVRETPPERQPAAHGYNEPTSMVPLAAPARSAPGTPEAVYNSRRPFSAVLFAVATVVLLVPAVLLLVQATFVDDPTARGVVPAVLLTAGLPLTGTGLYALAAGGRVNGRDAWLRPPLAYLPVGVLLLLAAGLAVA